MNKPNILWYCTDQQRFDTLSVAGNLLCNTPNIDKLADRGTSFTHAFCQSPVCTPSRASFLTGMYPSALSVNQNGVPTFPPYYADRLIPHRLSKNGYFCGLVGKLHIASAAGGQEKRVDDGYEYFEYSHDHKGPNIPGNDYAKWLRENGIDPETLLDKPIEQKQYIEGANNPSFGGLRKPDDENDNIPATFHQTKWCTEKAIDFLDIAKERNQPWFLCVNPFDPHPPFDPPWEYFRRYNVSDMPGPHVSHNSIKHQKKLENAGIDFQSKSKNRDSEEVKSIQAAYYAMIEQIDFEFGRILGWLETNNQMENTMVIFMSDHGEMLGDHGLLLKGCRLYEGAVRVPLLIAWPNNIPSNINNSLVELIDIAPTIYEAANLDVPYYVQGQSLLDIMRNKIDTHREFVRSEAYGVIAYPDQTHATMYRDKDWKIVTYHSKGISELFNLKNDPWELEDLSDNPEYLDVLIRLQRESFDATVNAHVPDLPRVAPY